MPGLLTPWIFMETDSKGSQVGCSRLAKQPGAAHHHHCWHMDQTEGWAAFLHDQELGWKGALCALLSFPWGGEKHDKQVKYEDHSQSARGFPCAVEHPLCSSCLDMSSQSSQTRVQHTPHKSASHLPQAELSSASSPPGILLGLSCILSAATFWFILGVTFSWRGPAMSPSSAADPPWGVCPKSPQEVPRLAPWTVFLVCFGVFCSHDHQSNHIDYWTFSSSRIIIVWNWME